MISSILFNPFKKLAGFKALLLGIAIMLITSGIAYFSYCHFDGALDAHIGESGAFRVYVLEFVIDWLSIAIIFYLTGILFSKSRIRWFDVAGTTALARYPYLFLALLAFALPITKEGFPIINIRFIVVTILILLVTIWYIALLYNAFRVSCNLKKEKAIPAFIVALIIAEILSKLVFHFLPLYY